MGKLNIVVKSTVPDPPYNCELVCVPVEAIPLVFIALRIQRAKYWYKTPEDWHNGISLLSQLESNLLMPCGQDIVNAVDRITTRFDAAMFGIGREATLIPDTENEYSYSPPLTQGADPLDYVSASMVGYARDTKELTHNLVDGTPTALTAETRNIRDMLQQVINSIGENGFSDEEIVAKLVEVIALL